MRVLVILLMFAVAGCGQHPSVLDAGETPDAGQPPDASIADAGLLDCHADGGATLMHYPYVLQALAATSQHAWLALAKPNTGVASAFERIGISPVTVDSIEPHFLSSLTTTSTAAFWFGTTGMTGVLFSLDDGSADPQVLGESGGGWSLAIFQNTPIWFTWGGDLSGQIFELTDGGAKAVDSRGEPLGPSAADTETLCWGTPGPGIDCGGLPPRAPNVLVPPVMASDTTAIALTPGTAFFTDGLTLFALDLASGTISVLTTATPRISALTAVPGRVYFVSDQLKALDVATQTVRTLGIMPTPPVQLAVVGDVLLLADSQADGQHDGSLRCLPLP